MKGLILHSIDNILKHYLDDSTKKAFNNSAYINVLKKKQLFFEVMRLNYYLSQKGGKINMKSIKSSEDFIKKVAFDDLRKLYATFTLLKRKLKK